MILPPFWEPHLLQGGGHRHPVVEFVQMRVKNRIELELLTGRLNFKINGLT